MRVPSRSDGALFTSPRERRVLGYHIEVRPSLFVPSPPPTPLADKLLSIQPTLHRPDLQARINIHDILLNRASSPHSLSPATRSAAIRNIRTSVVSRPPRAYLSIGIVAHFDVRFYVFPCSSNPSASLRRRRSYHRKPFDYNLYSATRST